MLNISSYLIFYSTTIRHMQRNFLWKFMLSYEVSENYKINIKSYIKIIYKKILFQVLTQYQFNRNEKNSKAVAAFRKTTSKSSDCVFVIPHFCDNLFYKYRNVSAFIFIDFVNSCHFAIFRHTWSNRYVVFSLILRFAKMKIRKL